MSTVVKCCHSPPSHRDLQAKRSLSRIREPPPDSRVMGAVASAVVAALGGKRAAAEAAEAAEAGGVALGRGVN